MTQDLKSKKPSEWHGVLAMLLLMVGFLFGLPAWDAFLSIPLSGIDSSNFLYWGLILIFGTGAYLYGITVLWKHYKWWAITFVLLTTLCAVLYMNTSDHWWNNSSARQIEMLHELKKKQSK